MDVEEKPVEVGDSSSSDASDDAVYLKRFARTVDPREPIFLGMEKMKLLDIQRQLRKIGVDSAFIEQVLVCDEDVIIKRDMASGEIMVEGPISDTYFNVRDVVFQQFVVV